MKSSAISSRHHLQIGYCAICLYIYMRWFLSDATGIASTSPKSIAHVGFAYLATRSYAARDTIDLELMMVAMSLFILLNAP